MFHADKVTTPLIILQNDKDGAVDFNQGVTYFNTLRNLGKDVIFLEYVGENHGLAAAGEREGLRAADAGVLRLPSQRRSGGRLDQERHPESEDGRGAARSRSGQCSSDTTVTQAGRGRGGGGGGPPKR